VLIAGSMIDFVESQSRLFSRISSFTAGHCFENSDSNRSLRGRQKGTRKSERLERVSLLQDDLVKALFQDIGKLGS